MLGDLLFVRMTELKARELDKPPPSFTCIERHTFATGILFLPGEDSDTELLYRFLKDLKRIESEDVRDKMPKDKSIIEILNMF